MKTYGRAAASPDRRPWHDLSKPRLFLALAFAPVLPIALGTLVLQLLDGGILWSGIAAVLAAAEIWSVPIGTLYLVLARMRDVVRRAHCLLLGAFLAFSLPSTAYLVSKAADWAYGSPPTHAPADEDFDLDEGFHGPSDSGLVFIVGLCLVPFGTLGGWIFWRVGVYPAQPKAVNVAAVFD